MSKKFRKSWIRQNEAGFCSADVISHVDPETLMGRFVTEVMFVGFPFSSQVHHGLFFFFFSASITAQHYIFQTHTAGAIKDSGAASWT